MQQLLHFLSACFLVFSWVFVFFRLSFFLSIGFSGQFFAISNVITLFVPVAYLIRGVVVDSTPRHMQPCAQCSARVPLSRAVYFRRCHECSQSILCSDACFNEHLRGHYSKKGL
eukprot:TRINITY_DN7490_c0_g1_i12.p1 TRINITY_DN7490_c0_g1~~TRINITY_DN7490_c0_g1_i12.p1  ORF type:complete len:114 (-),score=4.22 TRINITY_DN7490_c0_g1_i12:161-502(-)